MSERLTLLRLALVTLAALALVTWSLGQLTATTAIGGAVDAETGTITLVLAQEPPQLDSTRTTDAVSGFVLEHVTEGLITLAADGSLLPGVAERWSVDAEGATFLLRHTARWDDGSPVTAHDFVHAWRTALDPATASAYAFIFYPLANAEAIANGTLPPDALGAEAVGDWTLRVHFHQPVPYFAQLVTFSSYRPVQAARYRELGRRYGSEAHLLPANGPFRLTRWVHGAHLRLERNPHYWAPQRLGNLQVIDLPYVTSDRGAERNLFRDRRIALATLDSGSLLDAMQSRWAMHAFDNGALNFIEFNHRDGMPTANADLRRALVLAVDPGEVVHKVLAVPGNRPAAGLFPAWLPGPDGRPLRASLQPPPLRPADPRARETQARQHLSRALETLGMDSPPPLKLLAGESPDALRLAQYLQQRARAVLGVELRISAQTFRQRLAQMRAGRFDLVMAGWLPDYNDPQTFAERFASFNGANRGQYANPAYDAAVARAAASLDPAERIAAFRAMQRLLAEDSAAIWLYEQGQVYVQHPAVHGVVRRRIGGDPDLRYARVEPE